MTDYKPYLQSNGWDTEELYELMQVLDKIRELRYELDCCRRGCYTGALTYVELQAKVNKLAIEMGEAADYICAEWLDNRDQAEIDKEIAEEEAEDEDEDEDEDDRPEWSKYTMEDGQLRYNE